MSEAEGKEHRHSHCMVICTAGNVGQVVVVAAVPADDGKDPTRNMASGSKQWP
jgi:hypothetical protein